MVAECSGGNRSAATHAAEQVRQQVVEYVRHEICRYGIHRLTMDDIARGLRVSKRTLYQLFPQKTSLIRLSLDEIAREARQQVAQPPALSAEAAVRQLFAVVDAYVTLLHTCGSALLADMVPDVEYEPFIESEKEFWHRHMVDALMQCRAYDCLVLPLIPETMVDNLSRVIFEQCRQGVDADEQRLMCRVVLRGFFRREKIGYIDELLAVDGGRRLA